jgi:capsid protein
MNFLPRLRRRVTTVLFRRQFDAAGASRRWQATATMVSQPAAALAARAVLGRKAAWLVNKAPIAASIVDVWTTNLIGDGPSVRSGYPDRAVSRALQSAWSRLYRWVDVEGGDLVSVLNRVARALVTEGEAFVGLLAVGLGELRLQISPAAQVDTSLNEELRGSGSNLGQ